MLTEPLLLKKKIENVIDLSKQNSTRSSWWPSLPSPLVYLAYLPVIHLSPFPTNYTYILACSSHYIFIWSSPCIFTWSSPNTYTCNNIYTFTCNFTLQRHLCFTLNFNLQIIVKVTHININKQIRLRSLLHYKWIINELSQEQH